MCSVSAYPHAPWPHYEICVHIAITNFKKLLSFTRPCNFFLKEKILTYLACPISLTCVCKLECVVPLVSPSVRIVVTISVAAGIIKFSPVIGVFSLGNSAWKLIRKKNYSVLTVMNLTRLSRSLFFYFISSLLRKTKFSRFVIRVCVTCLHMSFQFARILSFSERSFVTTQKWHSFPMKTRFLKSKYSYITFIILSRLRPNLPVLDICRNSAATRRHFFFHLKRLEI